MRCGTLGAMSAPVVGVTIDFLPARGWSKYTVYDRYVHALRAAGALPIILPPEPAEIPRQLDLVDGVVLPGGDDLDPSLWGEEPVGGLIPSDPRRTAHELALVAACLDHDVPLFGVCLGLQALNVARGGSIVQALPPGPVTHHDAALDCGLRHDAELVAGTRLAAAMDRPDGGVISINSFHRQAPGRVGDGLIVCARARDGVIEALEHPERRFAVGVQWHPDVDHATDEGSAALWRSFVAACARKA